MSEILQAVAALGPGPLTEEGLVRHVHPLFSRVLGRAEIYLANHSLGRPLDRAAEEVRGALDLWYERMDDAWPAWLDEINAFRAGIARLIGLSRPDGVVPRPGAGQGLRAVLNALAPTTPRLVATRGEFDSIDTTLKVYAQRGRAAVAWVEPDADGRFHADQIAREIDDATDLVVVSHIFFGTGQLLTGLERIVEAAHHHGALVLVDAYHAAGVVPLEFERLGADFAIGGSYKYTRGGPGAGWLAIHPRHLDGPDRLTTLDTGWFAKEDVFAFRRDERPRLAPGGDAWLENTPVVLTAYQAKAGLELTLALSVERLRAYSLEQQAYLSEALGRRGVPLRSFEPRGAFMLIPSPDARALCARLKAAGVNTDARGRYVRVCPDILNTREEMDRAAEIIGRAVHHND